MSGTVIVVVVIAVFCLLVGPILMLKPTPRQRQLARLRARGAELGLKISTATLAGAPYTVYTAPWPEERRARFAAAPWTLVRKNYQHDIHLAGIWDHADQNRVGPTERPQVIELLERLPESVVGLGVSPRGLSAYWLEKGSDEDLERLAALLQTTALELWPRLRAPDPGAVGAEAGVHHEP